MPGDSLCSVPLAWVGLQPSETYEALIDSLLALDNAAEEVLGRVERRVASERAALHALEARISAANERAKRVAGSSDATVVLSAARYPAPKQLPEFKRLFYDEEKLARAAHGGAGAPPARQENMLEQVARREAVREAMARADDPISEYQFALSLRSELATNQPRAPIVEGLGCALPPSPIHPHPTAAPPARPSQADPRGSRLGARAPPLQHLAQHLRRVPTPRQPLGRGGARRR